MFSIQRLPLLGKIFTVVVVLIVGTMVYFYLSKKPPENDTNITTPIFNIPEQERVFVKDFYQLEDSIDSETQYSIERTLYLDTVIASNNSPDLYTGTIRTNSFSDTMSNGKRLTKLLIDIEPAKLTYLITVNKPNSSRPFIKITCASKEQQLYPGTSCDILKEGEI